MSIKDEWYVYVLHGWLRTPDTMLRVDKIVSVEFNEDEIWAVIEGQDKPVTLYAYGSWRSCGNRFRQIQRELRLAAFRQGVPE